MSRLSEFQPNYENKGNQNKSQEEELRNKYDQFQNMDRNQLNAQLYQEVARQKSAGTFDYPSLISMVEGLRGSLPEADYQNIKRILETLK